MTVLHKLQYLNILTLLLLIFSVSCNKNQPDKIDSSSENLYVAFAGERDGFKLWIVNGDEVRRKYFDEFIYGGNSERYPFIPANEIWIDNAISAEEFETTVAHEIKERGLMSGSGLLYEDAHDSALALEVAMRNNWKGITNNHENELDSVSPMDADSTMEIEMLPDKIKLKNIYRIPLGERNGVKIWVVDGYAIRRDIFPDFGFSGNDKEYLFIPPGEIWIDGQISCEETDYSIELELKERELMVQGKDYDDAYTGALEHVKKLREVNDTLISKQPEVKKIFPPYRDKGTGSGK